MEIPDAALTAAGGAVVSVVGGLVGAVIALWKNGQGKDRDLRDCERKNRRALRLARYEVESLRTGRPSVHPMSGIEEEPSIVRRVGLERDRGFFEDVARARAKNDDELKRYLDSEPPPANTKKRIYFR